MPQLFVRLFGRLQVEQGEHRISGLDARKAQELFCYLLLDAPRPRPREYLADLLCRDCQVEQSRKALRHALWELQSALNNSDGPCSDELLVIEADWLQIHPNAPLAVDVRIFEQAFATVRNVPGERLTDGDATALRSAVDLYVGDLLDGWYQDWCLQERERLQVIYLAMLDKLMAYSEARDELETGLDYGARSLRVDSARERAHHRLMRIHYLSGDRAGALRQWQSCVTALRDELGVEPAPRTVALYEKIRAGASLLPGVGSAPHRGGDPHAALEHLTALHARLGELQRDVEQQILSLNQHA